ncbi:hypothetical protein [Streptomyces sp. NPDC001135]
MAGRFTVPSGPFRGEFLDTDDPQQFQPLASLGDAERGAVVGEQKTDAAPAAPRKALCTVASGESGGASRSTRSSRTGAPPFSTWTRGEWVASPTGGR